MESLVLLFNASHRQTEHIGIRRHSSRSDLVAIAMFVRVLYSIDQKGANVLVLTCIVVAAGVLLVRMFGWNGFRSPIRRKRLNLKRKSTFEKVIFMQIRARGDCEPVRPKRAPGIFICFVIFYYHRCHACLTLRCMFRDLLKNKCIFHCYLSSLLRWIFLIYSISRICHPLMHISTLQEHIHICAFLSMPSFDSRGRSLKLVGCHIKASN